MATPRQLTQVAFAAPLNESTEGEILDPTTAFPVMQNVRQNLRGGLERRLGFASLPLTRAAGGSRSSGRRIFCHQGGPMCIVDATGQLDVYDDMHSTSFSGGRAPEATVSTRTLTAPGDDLYGSVTCNGFTATLTRRQTSNSTWNVLGTVETAAGAAVSSGFVLLAGAFPVAAIGSFGTTIVAVVTRVDTTSIFMLTLDCTSAATAALGWVALGSPIATTKNTSAGPFPAGPEVALSLQSFTSSVAIAFVNSSGGTSQVTILEANASGVIQSATVNTGSLTPTVVAVEGSKADTLWVSWNQSTVVKLEGHGPTTFSTVTATAITIAPLYSTTGLQAPCIVSGSTAGTCFTIVPIDSQTMVLASVTTSAGAATLASALVTLVGAVPVARPFRRGSALYGLFIDTLNSGSTGNLVMCDWTGCPAGTQANLRPVATAFPGLTQRTFAQVPALVTTTTAAYPMCVKRSSAGIEFALVTANFADPTNAMTVPHNGVTVLSGGVASYFDGRRGAELSFLHRPSTPVAVVGSTGTGPGAGTVRYVATYEEIDANGSWCFSGASTPTLAITTNGHIVTVTVAPILMSARISSTSDARVRVVLWRTSTISGAPPYFCVGEAVNTTGALVSIVDGLTDTVLMRNKTLYGTGSLPGTNGSALQRDAPPFATNVVSFNGMLVMSSGSDVWWSGQTVPGEGTWFSTESFFLTVDGAGDIVALVPLDGVLYILKERAIYACSGEPPSDNGTSGGLSQPYLVTSDVGCISRLSVVSTAVGIFFQSHRGIELLPGGGRSQWIGSGVLQTLTTYPIVTSAVLDEVNDIVRFSLATSQNADGSFAGPARDVVFYLDTKDWQSVDDKTGTAAHQVSQDAAMVRVGGLIRYAWIEPGGLVWSEAQTTDAGAYLDGGVWVPRVVETGWFKVGGIQGRQIANRVLLLARKATDANLSIQLAYNYNPTYEAARVWTYDQIQALLTGGWPITQLRHDPSNESDGQAIRVRISDAAPAGGTTGNGAGATWLALTFDLTTREGPAEVPEGAV